MKAWSKTNYSSNHDKLLKNMIDKLTNNSNNVEELEYQLSNSKETDYKDDTDIINAIHKTHLEILNKGSNNTASIADFDLLQSSLPMKLELDVFLTSAINWEFANTRDISTKTREICNI